MTPTAAPEQGRLPRPRQPVTRASRNPRSANRDAIIQSHGGLHGGDVSLDYIAAGPFTYDHATGLGTYPTFGYNDRTIDPNDGVVESLESGDFACGDHVTFFTQVAIDDGADGPGTVQLHQTWGMEPTGQPGLGFNNIVVRRDQHARRRQRGQRGGQRS